MNAIQPIARTDDTVTLRAVDFDGLLCALEDAEDIATLYAAGAAEDALGKSEARADHLPIELVTRLLDGESPVRIWREHRGMAPSVLAGAARLSANDLAAIETGTAPGSVVVYRHLARALGVTVDDLIGSSDE